MKKNKIFALMAAAMTFAACSTNDITSDTRYDDDNNVVNVGTVTRASEGSTTSQFTGTFLLTNVTQRENVGYDYEATYKYDSSSSTWTEQDNAKIMWYGSKDNVFQATYPCYTKSGYTKLENIEFNKFMIPGFQDGRNDSIPDWMRATANVARSNGALNLNFEHMLSKVTVVIDYNNITLDGNTVTRASVSKIFTRVQYCEAVTDADGKVTINPYQNTYYNTDGLYVWTTSQSDDTNKAYTTAIVAPGAYSNIAKAVIYCDNDDKEIVLSLPNGITLEAGKHYTFTLSSAAITSDQATISSVSVEPWTEGTISSSKPAEFIPYVTFTSNEEVKFMMGSDDGYTISGLEYSVNNGEWQTISADELVTFGGTNRNLRLRGKNLDGTASQREGNVKISFTPSNAQVACTGDIRTLLDYENYNTVETNDARFCYLFKNCSQLTSAPELPATTLANYCYYEMFYGCTSLTKAPELLATTLAQMCYDSMFWDCKSLTTAPTKLPATTVAPSCYSFMFYGCTSLSTAPELKAETLADECYSCMFKGCTSLTTAPELKATTLAEYCYLSMFEGCSNLKSVTMLATDVSASYCLNQWLNGAGTGATSRTLKVASQNAYDAIVNTTYHDYVSDSDISVLPDNWKIGATNTTVKDQNGTILTSSSTTP